jgi:hypothetical protein
VSQVFEVSTALLSRNVLPSSVESALAAGACPQAPLALEAPEQSLLTLLANIGTHYLKHRQSRHSFCLLVKEVLLHPSVGKKEADQFREAVATLKLPRYLSDSQALVAEVFMTCGMHNVFLASLLKDLRLRQHAASATTAGTAASSEDLPVLRLGVLSAVHLSRRGLAELVLKRLKLCLAHLLEAAQDPGQVVGGRTLLQWSEVCESELSPLVLALPIYASRAELPGAQTLPLPEKNEFLSGALRSDRSRSSTHSKIEVPKKHPSEIFLSKATSQSRRSASTHSSDPGSTSGSNHAQLEAERKLRELQETHKTTLKILAVKSQTVLRLAAALRDLDALADAVEKPRRRELGTVATGLEPAASQQPTPSA